MARVRGRQIHRRVKNSERPSWLIRTKAHDTLSFILNRKEVVHERCVTCLSKGGEKVPIYTDKRTGKKVIQYQIGYKYVPDLRNPGKLLKRPRYKTEVIGRSARVARKILIQREATWKKKKYSEELGEEVPKTQYTFAELMAW